MMHPFRPAALLVAAVAMFAPAVATPQARAVPYWASLGADKVRMRTGPGREFPAVWLYQRTGLPVKVVETYPNWRKISDPDGTTGWVQGNLLSEARTALVTGSLRDMRASPEATAAIVWRAEPGVVGRISRCARGWCLFDVQGRRGYIATAHIWGVAADERLP